MDLISAGLREGQRSSEDSGDAGVLDRPPETRADWRFSRSSGPGGQGVNTTDSRVELSFDVARSPSLPPHLRARAWRGCAGGSSTAC